MKPKITPEAINDMKFADYRKLIYKELKRMKMAFPNPEQKTNFLLISEWEFPDFKGKKLPLLIVGNLKGPWEKLYKTDLKKRKEKDFSYGKCNFGAESNVGQEFNFEVNHGKIKSQGEKALTKVLFKKVRLIPKVVEKLGAEPGEDGAADEKVAAAAGMLDKKKAEKVEKLKALIKEQASEMKTAIKDLKTQFEKVKNTVIKNLKKAKTGRKDLVTIKELQTAFNKFNEQYDQSHHQLKSKFAGPKKKLEKQNKEFAKLALAVKARKKSLAQMLADAFYKKKADRVANEKEVKKMQDSIKAAIDYRKIKSMDAEEKQINLKAIYATAKHKGPKFKPEHTDVVYKHLAS